MKNIMGAYLSKRISADLLWNPLVKKCSAASSKKQNKTWGIITSRSFK